jgi:hypothetical protein
MTAFTVIAAIIVVLAVLQLVRLVRGGHYSGWNVLAGVSYAVAILYGVYAVAKSL